MTTDLLAGAGIVCWFLIAIAAAVFIVDAEQSPLERSLRKIYILSVGWPVTLAVFVCRAVRSRKRTSS